MVLNPGEDRAKVVKRVEKGLEGVARRMSATLIAKVESPRLIKTYGVILQNLFARLYVSALLVRPIFIFPADSFEVLLL